MKRTILIILIVINFISLYSQEKQYGKEYINFPDTSYVGKINYIVHFLEDSAYYGREFPLFEGSTLTDSTFINKQLKNVVMYNFWFIQCSPCVYEIPILDSLAIEFSGKVDFIAITFNEKKEVFDFLKEHPFGFTQILMNSRKIESLDVTKGYPTTVITKDHKIIYWKSGGSSADTIYGKDVLNCYYNYLRQFLQNQINK
ncbi:MAG: TlpA family protein disulfide reductase [Bacteroidetes bacterium]|nr:TlpA family protein disulfide reductase [Bacteroidota bacterium]